MIFCCNSYESFHYQEVAFSFLYEFTCIFCYFKANWHILEWINWKL